MRVSFEGGRLIELTVGNITHEATDTIVNAANSTLMGGGGVDGAIHRAGGPAILEECKAIRAARGMLPPGQAVATTGGRLPARHVIHTVGPVWRGGNQGEPETLASCYREAVRLADDLGLSSLAFPSISTGAFGYPVALAARVALPAVQEALLIGTHVMVVRFVLFDQATFAAYAEALGGTPCSG
jgi:O-acetyl-ADP-ribose deacetylase